MFSLFYMAAQCATVATEQLEQNCMYMVTKFDSLCLGFAIMGDKSNIFLTSSLTF